MGQNKDWDDSQDVSDLALFESLPKILSIVRVASNTLFSHIGASREEITTLLSSLHGVQVVSKTKRFPTGTYVIIGTGVVGMLLQRLLSAASYKDCLENTTNNQRNAYDDTKLQYQK